MAEPSSEHGVVTGQEGKVEITKITKTQEELLATAEDDVKRLQAEVHKEEAQNISTYLESPFRNPDRRYLYDRELGAKVELTAAQQAANILRFAGKGLTEEQPLGQGNIFELTLLDIPVEEAPFGREGYFHNTVQFGPEGEPTRGLDPYFEEGSKIKEETLKYPQNPALAMRVIPYFYRDQRVIRGFKEHDAKNILTHLQEGEQEVIGTDLRNVSIRLARVRVPKEHSGYKEGRLQMSVVVDYLRDKTPIAPK
jgi:hypothetical protein